MSSYYIYILTNHARTLYIGVTNDLARRVSQHVEGDGSAFTHKYRIDQLVHYEEYGNVMDAIAREKQLKGWRRSRKIALIESTNPRWDDLKDGLLG